MSNGSPTAYLLWAILSCVFFAFLLRHLWAYDRFNCLKWDAGRQPGAFKRVMTYSYVATLPLLVFFSVAMTALKFKEGFFLAPTGQIIPQPFILWSPNNRHWLLPLFFVFSMAWSLELVTHLEELAFWLFLLHQGPGKHDWFHSWEFRAWSLGSAIAVLGMPLTAFASRRNLELTQPWIFLVGSSASTSTTLCFLYVLARFPAFLEHVKKGGAEPDVVVRLTMFYFLNKGRVIFRFLYSIPLFIVAIDAVQGSHPVVSSWFALDFLLMISGIGCFISSAITLLIFFPRPITFECGYKTEKVSPCASSREPSGTPLHTNHHHNLHLSVPKIPPHEDAAAAHLRSFRFPNNHSIPDLDLVYSTESQTGTGRRHSSESQTSLGYETDAESIAMPSPTVPSRRVFLTRHDSAHTGATACAHSDDTIWRRPEEPSVRRESFDGPSLFSRPKKFGVTMFGDTPAAEEGVGGRSNDLERDPAITSQLHPYVINFTSPIDLPDHQIQEPRPHGL